MFSRLAVNKKIRHRDEEKTRKVDEENTDAEQMLRITLGHQILENTHPIITVKLDFRPDNPSKVSGKHLTYKSPNSSPGHGLVSVSPVISPQYLLVLALVNYTGEEGNVVIEQSVYEEIF